MLGTIKIEIQDQFLAAVKDYNASQKCYTVTTLPNVQGANVTFLSVVTPMYASHTAPTIMYSLQEIPDMADKVMDWKGQPLTKLVSSGDWAARINYPVGDLAGNTLGVIGYGRIGKQVCDFALALGMKVKAFDPVAVVPTSIAANLDEIITTSDYLSLHIPLTSENEYLINGQVLSKMKEGVVIINCSRGALINLDDALAALNNGKLGGLGLDVFDPEPPVHHKIFDHENVTLTPHVMGLSKQSTVATFVDAAQGVRDVLEGKVPKAVANLK